MPSFFKKLLRNRLALSAISFGLIVMILGGALIYDGPVSADAAANCMFYRVKWGDTLGQISQAYHKSIPEIARANNIVNANLIFPGQRLCIPVTHNNTPPPPAGGGNQVTPTGSVADMIRQVFGPYSAGALRVAQCESGLNPNAYNPVSIGGSHASGVFQILYPSTWRTTSQGGGSPYNAKANIIAAHDIFIRDGNSWREWVCRPY